MRRNMNVILPVAAVSLLVVGGFALYAYEQSHHDSHDTLGATTTMPAPSVYELPNTPCHMHDLLPDPICTPGAIDIHVTQDNIQVTICKSHYTDSVRPSSSYTNTLKGSQMQAYGFTDAPSQHEEDHLISLELGGEPSDPKNLWPEPHASPNPKDKVENFLHRAVCAGRISLHDAQVRIATDWTTAENGLPQTAN